MSNWTPEKARTDALSLYKIARRAKDAPAAILPAAIKVVLGKRYGVAPAKLASYVDPLVYRENGLANPIPLPKTRNEKTLSAAVRKRRDAGGTLGRWESVAASLSAALGRPVSETVVRSLYLKGGGKLETSYVGRGTRKAAPATRTDDAAEVVAVTK